MEFQFKENYDVNDLVAIVQKLRAPDGCPWDKVQTHQSIRNDFIEEVYEAVEAIDEQDTAHLREELGDAEFDRLINRIHNINVSGERCLIVAESELHRTFILRDAIPAISKAFNVSNIRVVTQG